MSDIPIEAKDMAAWLDAVFPHPRERQVEQVDIIADLSETVLRVWLHYPDPGDAESPLSLIVKLPSRHAARRQIAETYHMFPREIFFYQQLARHSPIHAPACHFASLEPPALILEDQGRYATGDQEFGYQAEEARSVIRLMATFHSHWMQKADALEAIPMVNQPAVMAALPQAVRNTWLQCYPLLQAYLPAGLHEAVLRLADDIPAIAEKLSASPITLLHGDLRIENMLFDGMELKSVVDWQLLARGSPMLDLANFLVQSGDRYHRRQVESFALKHYAELLAPFSVSESRLWDEYRLGARYSLMLPIFVAAVDLQRSHTIRPLVIAAFRRLSEAFADLGIGI